jgi:hypothetical protein
MTFLACHRLLVPASALVLTAAALICSGCGSSSGKETAGLDSGTDGRSAEEESGGPGTEAGDTEPDGGETGVGPNEEAGTDGGHGGTDAGPSVSTVFTMDTPNVVRRSNIVLGKANSLPQQSMALGNGPLGIAAWAANGFTAQINRADTMPNRWAVAQLVIPGLAPLTTAANFAGKVDLYDAMLEESGGGMSATVFVRADAQEIVVDVTGADPTSTQTATLQLWSGNNDVRNPTTSVGGGVATLAETWVDSGNNTSGQTFGVMSGVTAAGQNVTASVVSPLSVQVTFKPNSDGSFRVVVAAPNWTGGTALTAATTLLGSDATTPLATLDAGHLAFWHNYWASVGLLELSSSDNSAQYVEALRTLYLFYAASEAGGPFPGSQAGLADLFSYLQDYQQWYPAGFWVWNLRMQVAANMGAGAFNVNTPVFDLYRTNLTAIETWTQGQMDVSQGICLPETMRFNGNGSWYNNSGPGSDGSCDKSASPDYNALTLSSGTEVALWVWQQYLMTGDSAFLTANYPLMSAAAQFLLASATTGSDGLLHTMANAHETQWDVQDPVTDIVAMQALFPAVVSAATILGMDASLVTQLNAAVGKIPPLPRTDQATHQQLLTAADDSSGTDVFAFSYQPSAAQHNQENLDLEAVWPYDLIGDQGTLTALAQRTYAHRMFVNDADWSFDAVDAARLGLASEVQATLTKSIQSYQFFVNGLALWSGGPNNGMYNPYVEELGIVTLAMNEAAVQDYDGLVRIAPALPSGWNAAGTIYIQGNSKVDFEVQGGAVVAVFVEAGSTGKIQVRNPWTTGTTSVVDGDTKATVLAATSATPLSFQVQAGHWYALLPASAKGVIPTVQVTGTPAAGKKTFGPVQIGL